MSSARSPLPRLALTLGEPAGVGPDLALALSQQSFAAELVWIGSADLLRARARQLGLPIRLRNYDPTQRLASLPGELCLIDLPLAETTVSGQLNPANAAQVMACLTRAAQGAETGEFDALVTGPVHKGVLNEAGFEFSGHTEFFADRIPTPVVMMLASPILRVALATTHLPLREVADAITDSSLTRCLEILHQALVQQFGLSHPRILVCGLNPHAGESGHLGTEEQRIIEPVLNRLRQQGMQLIGPLPADTLFAEHQLAQGDAVLAMYHDQGLPVLKHRSFGSAINITLGLPYIRTSVDHGTALSLAGTGQADCGSFNAAITQALSLIANGNL